MDSHIRLMLFQDLLVNNKMMLRLLEGEELTERFDGETTILQDTIADCEKAINGG